MRFKVLVQRRGLRLWFPVAAVLAMSACSSIPGFEKENERDARRYGSLPNLEVPPAFTAPDPSMVTSVPRAVSASAEASKGARAGSGVLPKSATVSVEGPPDARWLTVQAVPDAVWPRLMSFMQAEGYPLDRQDPKLGIMESGWVAKGENKPNQGGLQGLLSGVTTFFFKPEYMDRMRIRIERGDGDSQTRVFLTSQRMDLTEKKEPINGNDYEGFTWAASPENREFDAEMLERLMVYLTGNEEQSRAQIAASLQPRVTFVNEGEKRYLALNQPLPVSFNRTRAAVERLGFDIVKSDADGGLLQLSRANPRTLYEGVVIRGVELKPGAGAQPVTLSLQLSALSQGATRIDMKDVKGDQDLPQFTTVLGERLTQQLR